MGRVIAHPGQAVDDRGDAGQCPEGGQEPVRLGALAERRLDAPQLRAIEFRLAPGPARSAQRSGAPASPRAKPPQHTLSTHSQPPGDCALRLLPRREQSGRLLPPYRQSVEVPSRSAVRRHAPLYRSATSSVTILCRIQ